MLFSLLRSEMLGEPIADSVVKELDADRAGALLKLAKAQDLAHIVAAALLRTKKFEKHQTDAKAAAIAKMCDREQMLAAYRYERLKYAQDEILRIFSEEGIAHIPLKGAVMREFYPQPWHRSSCDIDILVHEEDLARACKVLCERADYRMDGEKKFHDIHLYSPSDVHLELHFNILSTNEAHNALLCRAWEFAEQNANNSYLFDMKREFFVFHHIAHMAYHFEDGGCGVKPFLDLFIMQTRMHSDFDGARALLCEVGLSTFFDNALALCRVWFMGQAHTALTRKMEKYLLSGGVYGTMGNRVLAKRGRSGGRLRYALSRVFAPKEMLLRAYPVLRRHPWLMPLMQVRRWFCILFGGRLVRGVRELSVNRKITKVQAQEADLFFAELGL